MHKLYHHPLCPFSRKVRFVMKELGMLFDLAEEPYWERRQSYLTINPLGTVPTLENQNMLRIFDSGVILEYLFNENDVDSPSFSANFLVHTLFKSLDSLYEIRKHCVYFDQRMFPEVIYPILKEKLITYFRQQSSSPNPSVLRAARYNIGVHFEYLEHLLSSSGWLYGESCSLADITAACHISVLDYMNEVRWDRYSAIKNWYSIIKSKPSFQDLLDDRIRGFHPPTYYSQLDF